MTAAATLAPRGEPRPLLAAWLWLLGLGTFFFLSYGFANTVTAQRANVPEIAFAWERHIPFLAWTIVPYWTTDLFYAISVLECRTREELRTQVRRLIAVQLICISGFLLVPLQFGWERPQTAGLFGQMFDALMSFDKPYNQAPSLHVALTAVLWAAFGRHYGGWALGVLRAWFVMMALSTLTTWQHHFIDLPAGLWAGMLVLALFPDRTARVVCRPASDPLRFRIAALYLVGAAVFAIAAVWTAGLGWLLLWPAGALAAAGVIYTAGRPELFRKANGAISGPAIFVLAPYIAGAWLSSRWFTRGQPAAQEIADGVWLGRMPRRAERDKLGVASIVDVTAELPCTTEGIAYRGIPMLDLLAPGADQLRAAVKAIDELQSARPTLVCCALGYSRSAAAVAAWLMSSGRARSVDEAVKQIKARRPVIVLRAAYRAAIEEWARG